MLSKKTKKEGLPLKDVRSDNKWFAYCKEKFGSPNTRNRLRRPYDLAAALLIKEKGVAHSSPTKQRECSMKGSDSIVLPLAFKRVPCEEERRKSPVRVLEGGGGSRDPKVELGRSVTSRNLQRNSNQDARRRGLGTKDLDNFSQSSNAYTTGETRKEQLGLPAEGRPSGSSTTRSSVGRDLRRRSESALNQAERGRGPYREDDKYSLGRRKSVTPGTQVWSSHTNNTFAKTSLRADNPYEVSTTGQVHRPCFRGFRYANESRAGPSFSEESSSEDSHGSLDIACNPEDKQTDRRSAPGESNNGNDSSSCSSSQSISPHSLNSRLTEMNLQPELLRRASAADDRLPVTSERESGRSTSFSRTFPMGSSSVMQSNLGNRGLTGKDVSGLVGLVNEGNTCYLNSCLQCLAHSLPLASAVQGSVESLLRRRRIGTRAGTSERDWSSLAELLAYSFRQVVRDLWHRPAFTATSARMFLQCVQAWAPQFAGHSQHDTQEVLRAILDGLHEALNRVTTAPPYRDLYLEPKPEEELADLTWRYHKLCQDSIIQDIFCGQLQSTIECCTCHRKSHCFDPFHDLSLPLPKNEREASVRAHIRGGNSRARVTLHDCLSAFVAPEQLEGSNKYYCPGCKRFYKSERCSYQKDDTPVYYPLQGLDFTDFLSARARRSGRQGVVYDLYGVCCHMGSLGCGHYTAQCRNCENDVWYCFNDSSVSPLQDAAVLSSSAYILFYQQRS